MSRYDLDRSGLAALLEGEPAFRVNQLYEGLYHQLAAPEQLTTLPRALRSRLAHEPALACSLEQMTVSEADEGRTRKFLFRLIGGALIETVLMCYPRHVTVCVSSQAGCAMACTFCATGDAGFSRQLSTGEILEQVVHAARSAQTLGRRLDHVVFMGMGEPFANAERVLDALGRLRVDLGFSARHLTVSTVGVIPGIRRLALEAPTVNLAVSLHAARDELRTELVPLNRRYPIGAIMGALEDYLERTHRRISFEWALIDQVNDTDRDVAELAVLARRLGAHVNLIPLNPTVGGSTRGYRGTPPARVRAFRDELATRDVNVTVRQTRGRAIDAACGQLAGAQSIDPPRRTRAASQFASSRPRPT